jgi:hypothetical protein
LATVAETYSRGFGHITAIHDIGLKARMRGTNGAAELGFRITVGGGTATMCRSGNLLHEFAPAGELLDVAEGKLGAAALMESVHRAYLPTRVLAFAEDVPIGEGRHPVDGQPAAYVCQNRTCDAPVTSVNALRERCAA